MNLKDKVNYLVCPVCGEDLILLGNESIRCSRCSNSYSITNGIFRMLEKTDDEDVKLSLEKWDSLYRTKQRKETHMENLEEYRKLYFSDLFEQFTEFKSFDDTTVYLELGCGPFYLGNLLAKDAKVVIGVDFSYAGLELADELFKQNGIENYILVQGNVLEMPIKKDSIDFIYGGGVIEHFKDTSKCLDELYGVLDHGGVSFNTVPYLNLGTLTYRQLWGNIPNIPFLKPLFEFLHLRVLKGKHMIFGYEMSFLGSTLKKVHEGSGFKNVVVDRFRVALMFKFLPTFFRRPMKWLAQNCRLFWPMVKVIGVK